MKNPMGSGRCGLQVMGTLRMDEMGKEDPVFRRGLGMRLKPENLCSTTGSSTMAPSSALPVSFLFTFQPP
jgi:hypothetical protein